MKATTQLRNLLKEPGMLVAPGCVDTISALVNRYIGFKAVYVTGSGTEAAMLGYPDMGLKTLTEITTQAGRIADATGLPVICDAEAGFGSYINMVPTVREFEKAGVAAIHVEDQVCRWSTIMSVVNRSGKMSVHERIDIDPERTGKAPSAQRYPGRSDISG